MQSNNNYFVMVTIDWYQIAGIAVHTFVILYIFC